MENLETNTVPRRKWVILAIIFLAVISFPYLIGALAAGKDYVFAGFLLNPGDSNSYLAKMYEGWNGSWIFTLPYTANPGQGGYINLLYIFLGHLARWINLPLITVYHAARMIASALLFVALAKFMVTFLRSEQAAWTALIWCAFGSGLGWMLLLFGIMTADTWVIDAYPFLSAFVIPHFALALAIVLWLFSRTWSRHQPGNNETRQFSISWQSALSDIFAALLLSLVSSFGVVIVLIVLGGDGLLSLYLYRRRYWQEKDWLRLVWIALGGGPMLTYQLWLTQTDPVLAIWNAQNLTPSPAPWDILVSFSPALLLAVFGGTIIFRTIKPGNSTNDKQGFQRWLNSRFLLVWAVLGLLLLYVPFDLQRRFILGLYIPIVALAVIGLEWFTQKKDLVRRIGFSLSLPTNLFILFMLGFGMVSHAPVLYLTQDEAASMSWIRSNASPNALVLAAPDTGLFIPADTSRRVLYGHQYETVNATQEKQTVESFFEAQMTSAEANSLLQQVDIVFCGPREKLLSGFGTCPYISQSTVLFQQGQVTLYSGGK